MAEFTKPHSAGVDLVTGEHDHFLLGFEAQAVRYPALGADAFGHSGAVGGKPLRTPEVVSHTAIPAADSCRVAVRVPSCQVEVAQVNVAPKPGVIEASSSCAVLALGE